MFAASYLSVSASVTAVGAAVLLFTQFGSPPATPEHSTVPEIRPAAAPFDFDFSQTFPWAVGPGTPVSSTGAAALSAISAYSNGIAVGAAGALQTANQFGPLAFALDSIKSVSANQAPNGAQPATVNVTSMDQWALGLAGLASSTGAVGFTEDAAAYDPFLATHAGFLQTNNNFGPMFFNLNVLKAIGLTQAPSGTVLPTGQPDDFSAVDIGRWSAGIPGIITNTGTTGFVVSRDFGAGPINDYYIGGLHTTTTIGSMTFDFNVLPSISTSIFPPGISFTMSPDMTAAETAFAAITPPPPGVIQPPITSPAPLAAASTPASATFVSGPPPADPVDEPKVETARVSETKPKVEIPGVNGVPLAGTSGTGTTSGGAGNDPFDPFKPFRPVTDAIKNGIETFTGTGPTTAGGTGSGSTTTSGGANAGSSTGSDGGSE
jgi:hypothetical protein